MIMIDLYKLLGVQFEFYFSNSPSVNLILKELMPQQYPFINLY